jgi:AraC family transcriptional activator of pobA
MTKKTKPIPIHSLPDGHDMGIMVGRMSSKVIPLEEATHAHRHDFHFFIIQEKGMTDFEVDFKKYRLPKSAVLYIHPDQVHRFLETTDTTVCGLLITSENLRPEYISLLEEIVPAKPLLLNPEALSLISDTATLCIKSYQRQQDKVYTALLKDTCNALVALILSSYLEQSIPTDIPTRFESISKTFKTTLDRHFTSLKRPGDYAKMLNVSTAYLNECVKNTTGQPVSYHIQQRIILEAKRLLYHSDKSVKEIATTLGYEDYPYFSRLFTKIAGMTAMSFRNKNHD